jgi:hypothetical protein
LPVFSLLLDGIQFCGSAQEEPAGQQQFPEQVGYSAPLAPRTCKQPYIAQGIQIDLYTKSTNVFVPKPIQNLTKIRVSLPTNSVELSPFVRMDTDEIAPTTVVRAQDQTMPPKQRECLKNVALLKFRAIAANNHDFLIAESHQGIDRVLKPLSEGSSALEVNLEGRTGWAISPERREEM